MSVINVLLAVFGRCLIRPLTVRVRLTAAQSANLLNIADGQLWDLIRCEIRALPAISSICLPARNKCRSHLGPSAAQTLICPIPSAPFKDVSS